MFGKTPHCVSLSSSDSLWSCLALALALLGIMLPVTGLPAWAQVQNLYLASGSSDEQEKEFPDEEGDGDSTDGYLDAHLVYRGSPRKSLPPRCIGWKSQLLVVTRDSACFHHAFHNDRDAAACSAARLPLRC